MSIASIPFEAQLFDCLKHPSASHESVTLCLRLLSCFFLYTCIANIQRIYETPSKRKLCAILSSKMCIIIHHICIHYSMCYPQSFPSPLHLPIVLAIKYIKHIYFLFFFCNTSLFIFSISMLICLFSISFVFNFQFFSSHCLHPFIFFFFLMYLLLTAFSCYSSEDLF